MTEFGINSQLFMINKYKHGHYVFHFLPKYRLQFFLSTAIKMKQLTVMLTGFTDGFHITNREKSWKKKSLET